MPLVPPPPPPRPLQYIDMHQEALTTDSSLVHQGVIHPLDFRQAPTRRRSLHLPLRPAGLPSAAHSTDQGALAPPVSRRSQQLS